MARTVRNPKIDTRTARARLFERREPYWTVISEGCALGYRRGAKGGTWIARFRGENGRQHYEALGAADDTRDPDGLTVFSFPQAQARACDWFKVKATEQAGDFIPLDRPYTVADAVEDYLADYHRRSGKATDRAEAAVRAWILPDIGSIPLSKLTKRRIQEWHQRSRKYRRAFEPGRAKRRSTGQPTQAPKACAAAVPQQIGSSQSSKLR